MNKLLASLIFVPLIAISESGGDEMPYYWKSLEDNDIGIFERGKVLPLVLLVDSDKAGARHPAHAQEPP